MAIDDFTLRYDSQTGFHILGKGAIGGKAQGLAILSGLLKSEPRLDGDFPDVEFNVPRVLVIAGSVFKAFVAGNGLEYLSRDDYPDEVVAAEFLSGQIPPTIKTALGEYIEGYIHPLAVRSSSMFEDDRYHAYAGLYRTYMIANNQVEIEDRLANLVQAVKLVYASTFYQGPKAYARRVGHRLGIGRMAVIVQQAVGRPNGKYFYPAISGVIQSCNYYPQQWMKPEEGIATIALGLGKQVVSGERALRFCPKYPKRLFQRSTVEDVLAYAQHHFYALDLNAQEPLNADGRDHVVRRHIDDAIEEAPIKLLSGTYVLAEHRVKDTISIEGPRVLTFANVLKYDLFPLSKILQKFLNIGEAALNGPVEMEFAVDIAVSNNETSQFHLLQMRPLTASKANVKVSISAKERERALCFTRHAMGNEARQMIWNIMYVKPEVFDPAKSRIIASQVAEINSYIAQCNHHYLLVGPGRWGTADPWLGIPVRWSDISNVVGIVETGSEKLKVEHSIGVHFLQNLVSLGISYLSIVQAPDHFDWAWLTAQEIDRETEFVVCVRMAKPVALKVDGRTSSGVILL